MLDLPSRQLARPDDRTRPDPVDVDPLLTWNQRGRLSLARGPQRWRKPPVAFGLRLRGDVRPGMLETALTTVARRHAALRTHFPETAPPGRGRCFDARQTVWATELIDVTEVGADQRAEVVAKAYQAVAEPFDPGRFPLYRSSLLRDDDESVLLIAVDHLLFDGTSLEIFLADLEYVYGQLSSSAETRDLEIQVSDSGTFAEYEREWLCSPEADEAMSHWSRVWHDLGPYPDTRLPAARTPQNPGLGAECRRRLSARAIARTRTSQGSWEISLPALASAAVLAALRDITGQTECALLHPASRRFAPGSEQVIGYLNNRILLRARTPLDASFGEIIELTRDAMLDSLEHDMMPFEVLLERLAPTMRDLRPDRPYIHLNVQSRSRPPALAGLDVSLFWPDQGLPYGDLPWISIDLEDDDDHPILSAGYSTAYFDHETVESLLSRVAHYLTSGR